VPIDGHHVLLVDDDADIREALSEMLRYEGFVVATAQDGSEAIGWLREQRLGSCAIVLDLMMPVMDGNEFLLAKRADPGLVAFPVVVVTASAGALKVDPTPDVKACLSKPIDLDRLLAALHGQQADSSQPVGHS
jgi:two-component system chemotaxis response regulator CheY